MEYLILVNNLETIPMGFSHLLHEVNQFSVLIQKLGVENKLFKFLFILFEFCMTLNFTISCMKFILFNNCFQSMKTLSSQEFNKIVGGHFWFILPQINNLFNK